MRATNFKCLFDLDPRKNEVPISKSFKNIADVIEKTSRGTPITPLNSPAAALPSK